MASTGEIEFHDGQLISDGHDITAGQDMVNFRIEGAGTFTVQDPLLAIGFLTLVSQGRACRKGMLDTDAGWTLSVDDWPVGMYAMLLR